MLEVDYSTDVRRGKLGLYEAWGFPEVWVEVPEAESPSRSSRRPSGLAIRGVLSMTAVPALLGTGVPAMALVVGGGVAGALRARQTRDG